MTSKKVDILHIKDLIKKRTSISTSPDSIDFLYREHSVDYLNALIAVFEGRSGTIVPMEKILKGPEIPTSKRAKRMMFFRGNQKLINSFFNCLGEFYASFYDELLHSWNNSATQVEQYRNLDVRERRRFLNIHHVTKSLSIDLTNAFIKMDDRSVQTFRKHREGKPFDEWWRTNIEPILENHK